MACTPKPFCPVFSVVRSSGLHSCTCTLCICVAKPFLILEFSKEKLECGNVLWHCFFILPIPIELRGSLQSLRPLFMERAHCLVSRASALARQQSLTHLTKKKWCNCHTKKKAGGWQSLSLPSWLNPLFVVCKIRCISFEFTPFLMWSAYLASVHSDELCCFVSCPLQLPLPFFFFFF